MVGFFLNHEIFLTWFSTPGLLRVDSQGHCHPSHCKVVLNQSMRSWKIPISWKECSATLFWDWIFRAGKLSDVMYVPPWRYIHGGIDHLRLLWRQFYTGFWFCTSLLSGHLGKPQSLRLKHVRPLYGFLPFAVPTSSDGGTLQGLLWSS